MPVSTPHTASSSVVSCWASLSVMMAPVLFVLHVSRISLPISSPSLFIRSSILHHAFGNTHIVTNRTTTWTSLAFSRCYIASSFPALAHNHHCSSHTFRCWFHFVLSHTSSLHNIHWHLPNIFTISPTFAGIMSPLLAHHNAAYDFMASSRTSSPSLLAHFRHFLYICHHVFFLDFFFKGVRHYGHWNSVIAFRVRVRVMIIMMKTEIGLTTTMKMNVDGDGDDEDCGIDGHRCWCALRNIAGWGGA